MFKFHHVVSTNDLKMDWKELFLPDDNTVESKMFFSVCAASTIRFNYTREQKMQPTLQLTWQLAIKQSRERGKTKKEHGAEEKKYVLSIQVKL